MQRTKRSQPSAAAAARALLHAGAAAGRGDSAPANGVSEKLIQTRPKLRTDSKT